ncbi:MAG TPA: VOC family protein [Polyangiaceae bacterium]|nr:VOC family protein [Polyangiaceae bacterium]
MTSNSASDSAATGGATAGGLNPFKPRLSHVAYHVADVDRALHFYVHVLGMKEQVRLQLGKTLHEVVLGFVDARAGGVILMWDTERKGPIEQAHGYSRLVLSVADVDGAIRHLDKHGTPVVKQVTEAGAFRYALIKDPDGYVIELLQIKR